MGEQLGSVADWPPTSASARRRGASCARRSRECVDRRRRAPPHHGIADRRRARDETSLHVVARRSRVPVLAVAAGLETLPHRVVVGVDFSRASVLAARAAPLGARPGGADALLAYVRPTDDESDEACEGIGVIERQGVAASFERLRADIAAPPGIAVETLVLDGGSGVVAELRALAQTSRTPTSSPSAATGTRRSSAGCSAGSPRTSSATAAFAPRRSPSPPTRSARRYQ